MTAPPPPPPTDRTSPGAADATGRRRVTRRTDGHLLAGVASGIADHLRIDPVLVRVGFVVLGVWPFPGFGLLLYLALAFVLPAEEPAGGPPRRSPQERDRGVAFYVGVALLVVAVLALLGPGSAFGMGAAGSGLALPVLLIGIGVALWVSDRGSAPSRDPAGWDPGPQTAPPAAAAPPWPPAGDHGATTGDEATTGAPAGGATAAPPAAETSAAETSATAVAAAHGGSTGAGDPPYGRRSRPAESAVWDPVPPRPRSPLGRVTLGVALSVAATLWALDVLGVVLLPLSLVLAAVLAVLGVGLVIGSVAGRARWLAWLAAPLAVALVAVAAVEDLGLPLRAGVGDRIVTVATPGEAESIVHRLGAGRLVLDLTEVASADLDEVLLDATLGAGELEVVVPPDLRITGRVRLEVGELRVDAPGRSQGRGAVSVDESLDVGPVDAPNLAADLRVGAGQLTVRVAERSSPTMSDREVTP